MLEEPIRIVYYTDIYEEMYESADFQNWRRHFVTKIHTPCYCYHCGSSFLNIDELGDHLGNCREQDMIYSYSSVLNAFHPTITDPKRSMHCDYRPEKQLITYPFINRIITPRDEIYTRTDAMWYDIANNSYIGFEDLINNLCCDIDPLQINYECTDILCPDMYYQCAQKATIIPELIVGFLNRNRGSIITLGYFSESDFRLKKFYRNMDGNSWVNSTGSIVTFTPGVIKAIGEIYVLESLNENFLNKSVRGLLYEEAQKQSL